MQPPATAQASPKVALQESGSRPDDGDSALGPSSGPTLAPEAATSSPCGVPVDSEGKSQIFRPWRIMQSPHHLTFNLVWLAFMTCQFATFSAAALSTVIREDLSATTLIMNGAGIAATSGAVVSRVVMGWLCDSLGPKRALPMFMLCITPAVFCMALITNGYELIVVRFLIGLSLGAFVTTQFCSSSMFNVRIVGLTNSCAAGWGNLGGGLAQLLMPLIYTGIATSCYAFAAWRWAFFIPGGMMATCAVLFMFFASDSPAGNFRELRAAGKTDNNKFKPEAKYALRNYRTWALAVLYGFNFGVELTVNNIIVGYVYNQFNTDLMTAGGVGSIFGLMNVFSRASGGLASDRMGAYFGMRGRLWLLFLTQVSAGLFCIGLGLVYSSFSGTVACLVLFAICVQMSEGATFSIVPFVSKRSLGTVAGAVGAFGSFGSVILQFAFFFTGVMPTYNGILWMGLLMAGVAVACVPTIHFPMWGSMFAGPSEDATEDTYYLAEFSADEICKGYATASLRFAHESRSQRGSRTTAVRKLGSGGASRNSASIRGGTAHGGANGNPSVRGGGVGANGSGGGSARSPGAVSPAAASTQQQQQQQQGSEADTLNVRATGLGCAMTQHCK